MKNSHGKWQSFKTVVLCSHLGISCFFFQKLWCKIQGKSFSDGDETHLQIPAAQLAHASFYLFLFLSTIHSGGKLPLERLIPLPGETESIFCAAFP
jgi:hypothetical protein